MRKLTKTQIKEMAQQIDGTFFINYTCSSCSRVEFSKGYKLTRTYGDTVVCITDEETSHTVYVEISESEITVHDVKNNYFIVIDLNEHEYFYTIVKIYNTITDMIKGDAK